MKTLSGLIERRERLYSDLDVLAGNEEYIDISKIIMYTFDVPSFSTSVKYGISTNAVQWSGSSAIIEHNLDGYVNVIVDDTLYSKTSFKISEVSSNKIKLTFSSPKYAVCTVRIFKIGEK